MKNKSLAFLMNNRSAGNMTESSLRWRMAVEGYTDRAFHFGGTTNNSYSYSDLRKSDSKQSYWFISGHLTYGVHNVIQRDVDYFMNIRESAQRLISKHQQWGRTLEPEDFIKNDIDFDNSVTRRLAGYCLDEEDSRYIFNLNTGERVCRVEEFRVNDEIYREALENAENVPFTVIKERLPESLVMLEKFYDLPPIFCFRFFNFNRSTHRTNPSQELMRQIREANRFDNEIYDACERKLTQIIDAADDETKCVIEARTLAMNAITRIDTAFDTNTEEASALRVFSLVNDLLREGKIILALEVLYLMVASPNINRASKENLVSQITNQPLPECYVHEKLRRCLEAPATITSRWLDPTS